MLKALTALSAIALLTTTAAQATAQNATGEKQFRAVYKELVETNTALSSGSCTLAAERMAARLKAAGFPDSDLHPFAAPDHPKEGGLVAVYPGRDPKLKAVLLLAHIDVVEAKREDWTRDPFKLVEENGTFYARGSIDDKAEAAIWVDTLVRFRQEHYRPRRTIKLALTCGEETAGAFNGAEWLVAHQRDLIDAAFAVNEGASGELDAEGHRVLLEIQAGEKTAQNFRLEVTNPGGHSSRPVKDNAIYRLAAALLRIQSYEFPGAVHRRQSGLLHRHGDRFRRLAATAKSPMPCARSSKDPNDTAAIALVSCQGSRAGTRPCARPASRPCSMAGHATNALPQRARANINCRIFPGVAAETVRAKLEELVADPGGQGHDARDPRAELAAAAAARRQILRPGREARRGVLSRRAGAADPAAGRDRRPVLECRRHPDLRHRAPVRRPRSRPHPRPQRICRRAIAARLPRFSLSPGQDLLGSEIVVRTSCGWSASPCGRRRVSRGSPRRRCSTSSRSTAYWSGC